MCIRDSPRPVPCAVLLLAIGSLAGLPAAQQFGPQQVLTSSASGAWSVVAADVDRDGDRDVLTASRFDHEVSRFENRDGLGGFGNEQLIAEVAGASSVFAVDVDGDGDQDLLSASSTIAEGRIAWYENIDGLGACGPPAIISNAADGARSVFAADLDGDGDPDVLSATYLDDTIAWYANLPSLTADVESVSLAAGGAQQFSLRAGPRYGSGVYLLLGSLSGTERATPIDGQALPLDLDDDLLYTLTDAGGPLLSNTLGVLQPNGTNPAPVAFHLPPGLDPALAGSFLHHAYVVLNPAGAVGFASDAVPLELVP